MKKKRTTKLISLGLCLGLLFVAVLGVATVAGAQDDVLPHVHECDSWTTTAPTCGQNGERSGHCTICDKDVTEPIPATGAHTYVDGKCTCGKTFTVEKDADGYYLLDDADKLYWFAEQVNGGTKSINAKLTADIVVNSGVLNADGTPNYNANFSAWTPIGNSTYPYTGTFDGQGHTISGLYRENTDSSTYVGLFGYVNYGTVKNVAVKDSYISQGEFAGGIAGYNYYGTIENCSNAGTVMIKNGESLYAGGIAGYNYYGTIENCSNAGTVKATSDVNAAKVYSGGIAGMSDGGTITGCHNTGTVTATGGDYAKSVYSGGIAGMSDGGTITGCHNTGTVTATGGDYAKSVYSGGIAGMSDGGTISNCSNAGTVTATGGDYAESVYSGGIAGQNASGTIKNCYNIGTVTATGDETGWIYSGGIVGEDDSGTITNCYYLDTSASHGVGSDASAAGVESKTAEQFANGEVTSLLNTDREAPAGAGTADDPYQIANAGDLYWFAAFVNNGGENLKANAVLTADIVVNSGVLKADGTANAVAFLAWTPIGNSSNGYKGTFDGQGHTISGLYYSGSDTYVGLFGYVESGTVRNVTVKDSYFSGVDRVGAIAGYNGSGKITNCSNAGTVTLTGNATNYEYVSGGIVGYNDSGAITNCSNVGTVTATRTNAYSGGIAGYNVSGTITDCSNAGTVTATANNSYSGGIVGKNESGEITNCANSGTTSGTNNVGGIVGTNVSGTITGCSNSGATSGSNCAGGIVGNNGSGTITNCYNTGKVTAAGSSEACSGGIVGTNDSGTITNCYNTGNVTAAGSSEAYSGGIAGMNDSGAITYCYNTGNVAATDGTYVCSGGIAGQNDSGTLGNCYATGTVTATGSEAGTVKGDIVGASFGSGSATDCEYYPTSDKFSDGTVAYLLNENNPAPVWRQTLGTDTTPNFTGEKVNPQEEGTGYKNTHNYVNGICAYCGEYEQPVWDNTDGYYQIANAGNLYWFAEKVGLGYTDLLAELTADITVNASVLTDGKLPFDTSALRQWTPIGNESNQYKGTFDGNGKTISGLYYNGSDEHVGLFGYIQGGATIQNLGVIDSCFQVRGETANLGGIVGYAYSTTGSITISNCSSAALLTANANNACVGGVVGSATSQPGSVTIQNCSNIGKLTVNCTDTAYGIPHCGGVVGFTYSVGGAVDIQNCFNTGELTATSASEYFSPYCGGVVGYIWSADSGTATLKNCFSTGTQTATWNNSQGYSGGVVGYANANDGNSSVALSNCYCTAEKAYGGKSASGDNAKVTTDKLETKTADQFASGEVTYLLNGSTSEGELVWKQTLSGEGKQALPAFSGDTVYYGYQNCADGAAPIYANTALFENKPEHGTSGYTYTHGDGTHQKLCALCGEAVEESTACSFANGICSVCDGYEMPNLTIDGYEIKNAGNLYWFAQCVKTVNNGANAVLTADITVNPGTFAADGTYTPAETEEAGTQPRQWTPIGNSDSNAYQGTFDGNGHTISGLYYNGSDEYVGLFRYLHDGAKIQNLGVIDSYFQTNASATAYVGGLAGRASTALNAITVENCYATGTVNAYSDEADAYVGGLVGYVIADSGSITVENCYATGTVNAYSDDANAFAGGLVGYTHAYGSRITVKNCYATGKATANANATATSSAGGLVGFNSTSSALVTIENCYYLSDSATQGVGNNASATGVAGKTESDFASGEVAYLLNGDQTTVVWHQTLGTDKLPNFTSTQIVYTYKNCKDEVAYANEQKGNGAHPGFANGFCTVCGGYEKPAQDDSNCYLIDNAGKLYWFSQYVNVGNTSINAVLTADITVNPGTFAADGTYTPGEGEAAGTTPRQWTPIGKGTAESTTYNGTFDGNGHTISGLYYSGSDDYVGLFGSVGMNGKVQNVTVKDTYFKGGLYVGGIVGYNKGTVTNCVISGTVIGTNDVGGIVGFNYGGKLMGCTNSGSVSGANSVGGVVGQNDAGTITSCHNSGAVSGENRVGGIVGCNSGGTIAGTADQYTTNSGTVGGKQYVGGIVGENENTSSGAIGTIRYCENSAGGTVTGADDEGGTVQFTGGIVGYNNGGKVENCQNKAAVTGDAYVGGIAGNNSASITSCKNSGAVNGSDKNIGGIAGQNNGGTIQNCENSAKVMCTGDDGTCGNIGGIVGYNSGSTTNVGTITSCKNTGDVSGIGCVGGIVGNWMSNGKVTLCENSGNVSGWSGVGGIVGYVYDADSTISDCANSGNVTGVRYTYEGNLYNSQYIGGIVGMGGSVLRCINVGTITGELNVGNIVGETGSGKVENSYYLSATETADGGKTAAQFASGEVTWLLNGSTSEGTLVWKQTIGTDKTPNFTGGTVYKLKNTGCSGAPDKYSNDASEAYAPMHGTSGYTYTYGDGTHQKQCKACGEAVEDSKNCTFNTDGFCTVCDGYQKPAGTGAADDPYQIANAGNLYWFAAQVNGVAGGESKCAVLTADITVNPGTFAADGTYTAISGETPRQWTPIGNDGHAYTGTFNGQNHTISGLYYNSGSNSYVGLFGYLNGGATIQNVTVTNSYFQTSNSWTSLGGIVGNAEVEKGATITISGCSSAAHLVATGDMAYVGGVLGRVVSNSGASVTIQNCANTGEITATSDSGAVYCGGVAGSVSTNEGSVTLQNCFSTDNLSAKAANRAAYCGGVAGYVGAVDGAVTLQNCFSTGNLSATSNNPNDSHCGGVAGYAYVSTTAGEKIAEVKISNCYYTADNPCGATKCDGDGASMTLEANKKTADQFASGEVTWRLNGDQTTVVWHQTLGTDNTPNFTGGTVYYGYRNCADKAPVYTNDSTVKDKRDHNYNDDGFCTACGDYEAPTLNDDGYYEIKNAGNLYWFAQHVNSQNGPGDENPVEVNAKLMNDIKVNADVLENLANGTFRAWKPIGSDGNQYAGTFDGNGKIISGLYYNGSDQYVGLFGYLTNVATVKDVTVTDSYFCSTSTANNMTVYVGGLVGYADAYTYTMTIQNCVFRGTIIASGSGSGYIGYVGGLVGYLKATSGTINVKNCSFDGKADASDGNAYAGGLAGKIDVNSTGGKCNMESCHATGDITASGNNADAGGLIGYADIAGKLNVTDCHATSNVTANSSGSDAYAGGLIGYAKATGTTEIANCYATGDITASGSNTYAGGLIGYAKAAGTTEIANCYATGKVNASGDNALAGGLIGYAETAGNLDVTKCYATGDITASASQFSAFAGGLIGNAQADGTIEATGTIEITNSYATGDVTADAIQYDANAGGLIGNAQADGTIEIMDCYVTSKVTASSRGSDAHAGGVIGYAQAKDNGEIKILYCFATGKVTASVSGASAGVSAYAGGVIGYADAAGAINIQNCYYLDTAASDFVGGSCDNLSKTNVLGKDAAQFASGEVTWLLNGGKSEGTLTWHQTIGTDKLPNFTSTQIVYEHTNCAEKTIYTNTTTIPAHGASIFTQIGHIEQHKETCSLCGDTINKKVDCTFDEDGFCTVCDGYKAPTLNSSDYYEIGNAGNLYWFARRIDSEPYAQFSAVLMNDIIINEYVLKNDGTLNGNGSNFRQWTPIGPSYAPYRGTFDGQGHTISGLYYSGGDLCMGLFGYVADAKIHDVTVTDSYFGCTTTTNKSANVGGLVGNLILQYDQDVASIRNCYFNGTIHAEASSYNAHAGGLVGNVASDKKTSSITIENCYATGKVTANGAFYGYAGGLIGSATLTHESAQLSVKNCYATAEVTASASGTSGAGYAYAGGMVGCLTAKDSSTATVTNCYATGKVTASGANYGYAGALVGSLSVQDGTATVTNCYYLSTSANSAIGKQSESGITVTNVTSKTATEFASGEVTYLLNGRKSDGVWKQTLDGKSYPGFTGDTVYYGYTSCIDTDYANTALPSIPLPHGYSDDGFCNVCDDYQEPGKDSNGYYLIDNAGKLYWLANYVNAGGTGSVSAKLTANIVVNAGTFDANGNFTPYTRTGASPRVWTPIANYGDTNIEFHGTFDGQGYTISGLYCNDESKEFVGLFGYVGVSAKVKNLGVVNSYFRGLKAVGGVAGKNEGTVTGCYTTGAVAGTQNIGGVVGLNYGSVVDCYNTGTVSGTDGYVGGVVGHNAKGSTTTDGKVENCLNIGKVTASGSNIGAVVGYNDTICTVNNCYYLSGTAQYAVGNEAGTNGNVTDDQLKSGEVTWRLSGGKDDSVWKQTLSGDGKQDLPGFTGKPVYNNLEVAGDRQYANQRIEIAKVTITWGAMVFSYTGDKWDPTNLKWENTGNWTAAGKITIKNDGNVDITAKVSFTLNGTYTQSFGGKVKFIYFDPAQSKDVTAAEVNQTIAVGKDIVVTPTIAADTVPPASFLQSGDTGVAIGKITITLDWTPTTNG